MNLRYLIAPSAGNETSVWLAFTVTNNTITGYYQQLPSAPFARFSSLLDNCINKFRGESGRQRFEYVHNNDHQHSKTHSKNPQEINVDHMHMRYPDPVDTKLVKNFLMALKACENNLMERPLGTTFLTQEVCDDIVKVCENYNSSKSGNGFLVASNDPYYLMLQQDKIPLPSIFEHEQCLKQANVACNIDNIKTPVRYLAEDNNILPGNNSSVVAGTVMPAVSEISTTMAFATILGIFGLRKLLKSTFAGNTDTKACPVTALDNPEEKLQRMRRNS
jgi:hypothetical protein